IDLFSRRTVEGVLVSARHRYSGDWLPTPARWALRFVRRRNRRGRGGMNRHHRRGRYEIVIDVDGRHRSWNTESRRFESSLAGRRVRMTATPLLGHVKSLEALDRAPSRPTQPTGAPSAQGDAPQPSPSSPSPAPTSGRGEDVLSQIPGYEHYGGSRPNIPGLDRIQQIP